MHSKVLDMGCVIIDPIKGKLLQMEDPAHGVGGDVFMQLQWPLHSGLASGWDRADSGVHHGFALCGAICYWLYPLVAKAQGDNSA